MVRFESGVLALHVGLIFWLEWSFQDGLRGSCRCLYLHVWGKTGACFELYTNLFCARVSVGNVSFQVDFYWSKRRRISIT